MQFWKLHNTYSETPGLLRSIWFSFSELQSKVMAQLLQFGLWHSHFQKNLKISVNTMKFGP